MEENASIRSTPEKISLKLAHSGVKRKITVPKTPDPVPWSHLKSRVMGAFGISEGIEVALEYTDEEGDEIVL
jgi:hypothetical protein